MHRLALALLVCCLPIRGALAHEDAAAGGCAHYLGNEGVLVSEGDSKILFDAFYANSYDLYALVPEPMQRAMLRGQPPFDGVDALFVSHVHGDHFTPEPALRYLRAQPQVRVFGSPQVAAALREAGAEEQIMNRVTAFDLAATDDPASATVGDIDVDVVAVPHSGGERMADIQNLSFRVTLPGSVSVVHLGDAGAVREDFQRHAAHWAKRPLHAAFPPYWLFRDETGQQIVADFLDAQHVVGVHVPASAAGQGAAMRLEIGYDLFTDPGETRALGERAAPGCGASGGGDERPPESEGVAD